MTYTIKEIEATLDGLHIFDRGKLWLLVRCVDVEQALFNLPAAYFDSVLLIGVMHMSTRDAAEMLGVSHQTVWIRYRRGLEYMADWLNGRLP